jgi:deoxyribonuclease IV
VFTADYALEFRKERARHEIVCACAHDSYLINLASPDPILQARSYQCFQGDLERAAALGLDYVVTHPGNATDGDAPSGLARNADAIQRALEAVENGPGVLLETTPGAGHALGARFEQLAEIVARISPDQRERVGVCFDTCHVWVAGYDLVSSYDAVMSEFDGAIGLERLRVFHCNDSRAGRGSRLDRHAHIGEGALGAAFFRRLMKDVRFVDRPKLIETPKGKDLIRADRRNLGRLRRYRRDP